MNKKCTLFACMMAMAILPAVLSAMFIFTLGCSKTAPKEETIKLKPAENPAEAKTAAGNDARVYASRESPEEDNRDCPDLHTVVRSQDEGEPDVFVIVENMPQFVGGDQARVDYMLKNIKYPLVAKETGATGTVYISFVVEKDGSVTNAQVLKGFNSSCEAEALRVVNSMPRWIPGTHNGRPVRVKFTLPVRFALG
jgi:periplasmic protein TonB